MNKDIIEAGKNTRFGSKDGADPSEAATKRNKEANPNAVRLAMKRLAASEFDIMQPLTAEDIAKKFGRNGTIVSGAQMIAVKKFQVAMKKGDPKILQQVTDDIDGKQVEKKMEASVTLADILAASHDEKFLSEPDDDSDNQESGA